MTDTMPYAHLGEALATDYLLVREQLQRRAVGSLPPHAPLRRRGGAAGRGRAAGSAPRCRGRWSRRLGEVGGWSGRTSRAMAARA